MEEDIAVMGTDLEEKNFDISIEDQYLTFEIEDEDYGISIENIKEIISICPITIVPNTPNYVKGIINLRGDIVVVVDVRKRFMKKEKEYDDLTCIVVVEYKGSTLGLIVDFVKEVVFITDENISTPPKAKLNFENQFIKSIGRTKDEVKLILDLDKLLQEGY